MGKHITLALFLILSVLTFRASAESADMYPFDSPALHSRFQTLTQNLRCLVCQNENLAESNAALAKDLRRQVYVMVKQGKSSKEILDFLVTRYGDFILFRPPVKPTTYLIWYGPFVLLPFALLVLFFSVRKKSKVKEEPMLNDNEQQLLDSISDRDNI